MSGSFRSNSSNKRNYEGRNRNSGGGYRSNRDDRDYKRRRDDRSHAPMYLPQPPPEPEEDIPTRLRGLIIKLSDKGTADLKVNLPKLTNILLNDFTKFPGVIQAAFCDCVTNLPQKASLYATLLGLINAKDSNMAAGILGEITNVLKKALETGGTKGWRDTKLCVRFLGECVNTNIILPSVFLGMLRDLTTVFSEAELKRERGDSVVMAILGALPYCGAELVARKPDDFNQILSVIESYIKLRGTTESLDILKTWRESDDQIALRDPIIGLWDQIQNMHADGWRDPWIFKFHTMFDGELNGAMQHDLPNFTIPLDIAPLPYLYRPVILRILDDASQPEESNISHYLIHDLISDIIGLYEINRKECAKYLALLSVSFNEGVFKARDSPAMDNDDLAMADDTPEPWNLYDLIITHVFSQMFLLPNPPFRQVFYAALIIELCKVDHERFPDVVARVSKSLYNRLEYMDVECIYRFWTWLSQHLSNFSFQWLWDEWDSVLELNTENHPRWVFIRETLEKCIRLSYYERIKSTLPENLANSAIFPAEPLPKFTFAEGSGHSLEGVAKTVMEQLKRKAPGEEIVNSLHADIVTQMGNSNADAMLREVFVESLLMLGSKSFSHVLNVIERYLAVLQQLNTTPDARLATVTVVARFWRFNTQFLGILLDKLLNYRIIDPASVVGWIFSVKEFSRGRVLEILKNTIGKVISRVVQVQEKLHQVSKENTKEQSEQIRTLEVTLPNVMRDQKEVFLLVLQKFVTVIEPLLESGEAEHDEKVKWELYWAEGWFREIARAYYREIGTFLTTLEEALLPAGAEQRLKKIMDEVRILVGWSDAKI